MHRFRFLTPAVIAAILAVPALGVHPEEQSPGETDAQKQQTTTGRETGQVKDRWSETDADSSRNGNLSEHNFSRHSSLGNIDRASDILGRSVMGKASEGLAEIKDLIVDLNSGRVVVALLEPDGLAGIGPAYHAVPPGALTASGEKGFNIDAAAFKSSPKINLAAWKQALDHTALANIYQGFGETYHYDRPQAYLDNEVSTAFSQQTQREPEGTQDSDRQEVRGEASAESAPEQAVSPGTSRDNWGPPVGSAGNINRGVTASNQGDRSAGVAVHSGNMVRLSDLLGEDVETQSGEDLGEIKDLGIDLANGRVATVVISSGGFLGIGDQLRVVPPSVLTTHPASDGLQMSGTADQFNRAPHFTGRSWPIQNEAYVSKVYREFNVEPYFGSSSSDNR